MRRRPVALTIVFIVFLCAFAAVCAASWRIISPEIGTALKSPADSGDVDTSNLFIDTVTFNDQAQTITLSELGKQVLGEDFSITSTWKSGTYYSKSYNGGVISDATHQGVYAGVHYYELKDSSTGQVIAFKHQLTIAPYEVSLGVYTPVADFHGVYVKPVLPVVGVNGAEVTTVTLGETRLSYATTADANSNPASSVPACVNSLSGSVTITLNKETVVGNNYKAPEQAVPYSINNYALPQAYSTVNTYTYYPDITTALKTCVALSGTNITVYAMQSVNGSVTDPLSGKLVEYSESKGYKARTTEIADTDTGKYSHVLTESITIPSTLTLIIPYSASRTSYFNVDENGNPVAEEVNSVAGKASVRDETVGTNATYFKNRLTLGENVTLTNQGTIQVPGVLSGGGGGHPYAGVTYGDHSRILMKNGASIVSEGTVQCYGFIQEETEGTTTVTLKTGTATIPFSIVEHRGGSQFYNISQKGKECSPFNQFYMENICSTVIVQKKATLMGTALITTGMGHFGTTVKFFGEASDCFIQFTEAGCSAKMSFSESTGRNQMHVYGSASVNKISVSVQVKTYLDPVTISTADAYLPLCHYWDVTFDTAKGNGEGTATITATGQDVKVLPGCSVTICEGVTMNARNVAVYSSSSQIPAPNEGNANGIAFTYPEKDPGSLTVNGTLNVTSLGGYMKTESRQGTIKISGSATAQPKEFQVLGSTAIVGEVTLATLSIDATGMLYNSGAPADGNLTANFSHGSMGTYWSGPEDRFKIHYLFYEENGTAIPVSGYDSLYYTSENYGLVHPTADNLPAEYADLVISGWYWDVNGVQGARIEEDRLTFASFLNNSTGPEVGEVTVRGVLEPMIEISFVPSGYADAPAVYGLSNGSVHKIKKGSAAVVDLEEELSAFVSEMTATYNDNLLKQYYFKGFYHLDANGDRIDGVSAIDVSSGENITVYAEWGAKTAVKITAKNGSDGGTAPVYNAMISNNGSDVLSETAALSESKTVYVLSGQYFKIDVTEGGDTVEWTTTPSTTYTVTGKAGSGTCIAAGTMITLADGSRKPVEELTGDELILVFDHETGTYAAMPILYYENSGVNEYQVINLCFSDGNKTRLIGEHALFDMTLNRYVYIREDNYGEFIGHIFAKDDGNGGFVRVTLEDAFITAETVGCYSITTFYHLNYYIDGMLSIPGAIDGLFNYFEYDPETLRYDEEQMRKDIETYGLYTYEDFAEYATQEMFDTIIPAQYLKVSVGKGYITFEGILKLLETYLV